MIEDILRGARVPTPAYTRDQRAEDNRQLRKRIDQAVSRRAQAAQLREEGWLVPSSPVLAELLLPDHSDRTQTLKKRLERDLKDLCKAVLRAPGTGDRLVEFADASSPTDQVGARAFGCLLYLGDQDANDGARFWWRYAAGVGDSTAAYALFLEGLLRDEPAEAVHCYRAWDGSGFLCDEDWDTAPARISPAEPTLRAEVDEHIQEVTGPAGAEHLLIPSGYLGELSQSERDELCHQ
ncbi:hypothetical protein FBY35_0118 [Streptomyces sp. SLBN-118]|uniref:hypothetical protein n=1 Tax=Streptomyces sp. SLBN-118 TaxID=2768454 RepID=UPI001154E940|nr:hypothetical protein [Streptomyces sp. SLBN-118]TQK49844.1 hypothetical protein FBY35_0118 [Streptomyces sp. SLBN-118]